MGRRGYIVIGCVEDIGSLPIILVAPGFNRIGGRPADSRDKPVVKGSVALGQAQMRWLLDLDQLSDLRQMI
jgi:hypothetical protein